jgi:HK97 family phage prohead protease
MSLSFTGYAAIWDRMDRAGDVMRRGAFAGAGDVPLLWQHRGAAMGHITAMAEDDTGLSVEGMVDDPVLAALVRSGAVAGQPATLLGYPVVEAEDMPDVAENNYAIAFGNFQAGYLITERAETAILRDPYSNKPFVTFYATRRVGGCVSDSEAIKLMKFATA